MESGCERALWPQRVHRMASGPLCPGPGPAVSRASRRFGGSGLWFAIAALPTLPGFGLPDKTSVGTAHSTVAEDRLLMDVIAHMHIYISWQQS
jgi:hypothetical protein